ncbi:MAG: hypothetical protein HUU50_00465 [Candidatus Brocadiae bacterium]|nr:hypothetical protein [Candidatus Brocadiia bacterium]
MKLSCIICLSLLSLLFCSCNDQSSTTVKEQEPLQKARSLFEEKKWDKAAEEFDLAQKTQSGMDQDEAQLGSIVCHLLSQNPRWEEQIKLWQPGMRGYWHGKSFTAIESIPLDKRDAFYDILKKEDMPFSYLLLVQFLLLEGYENSVSAVVEKMPQHKKLAWDFILLTAWENLKQKQGNEGEVLFEVVYQNAVSQEQKDEAIYGILLGNFFTPERKKEISFPKLWEYRLDLKKISAFRSSSPLNVYRSPLEKDGLSLQQHIVFCDMLFSFGGFLLEPVNLWEQGLAYLDKYKQDFLANNQQEAYDCLRKRFYHAIAWFHCIKGDLEKAGNRFVFETLEGKKEREDLGFALILWKQGHPLSDIVKQLSSVAWKEEYFVGGRKFSFYRLPSRENKRSEIEKLWAEPYHKIAFILFDVFCLTGDGRSAHILLDQIVSEFPENIYSLYMAEEENIPKDPYAENQIWEKLD